MEEERVCDSIIIINASPDQNGTGEVLETVMMAPQKTDSSTADPDEGKIREQTGGRSLKIRKYCGPAVVATIIILVWCLFAGFVLLYHLASVGLEELFVLCL